ncbi:hypothetical protein [Planomicrobium okeanokoites]|uniref:hypothetical protein n=1 Tax=Planomicrobium okeanokoites TaxID=244 RepID=UPI0009FFC675|nr:hypothetical protein [Planomicrobium okeanokoites]
MPKSKCKKCTKLRNLNGSGVCSACKPTADAIFVKSLMIGLIALFILAIIATLAIVFKENISQFIGNIIDLTPSYIKTFLLIFVVGLAPTFLLAAIYTKITLPERVC